MNLLDEIIQQAINEEAPISAVLRKCLVLAQQIKSQNLKDWASSELNGYKDIPVPPYRETRAQAKGLFLGYGGSHIKDQPLPPHVLSKNLRHWAEKATLAQPIRVYEDLVANVTAGKNLCHEWPAGLTAMYQDKFIEGMSLNRAYQEIPKGALVGLIDTVRTKTLQFALELKEELGTSENVALLEPGKVDQVFNTIILGGNVVIGSNDVKQIGNMTVAVGNFQELSLALTSLGVSVDQLGELELALEADKKDSLESGKKFEDLGSRTKKWLKNAGNATFKAGAGVTKDIIVETAKGLIKQHLGLP